MLLFLMLAFFVLLNEVTIKGDGEYFDDYISHRSTMCINGFFTILIFLSHAVQYIELDGLFDATYLTFNKAMAQLVVATFLFYSGFGMMESINKRGHAYVKSIPFKRLFRVWYHFAFAILLYTVFNLLIGKHMELRTWLLSFTGYSSIGNSNWYMFVTFAMYIIIFIGFVIAPKHKLVSLANVWVLTLCFIAAEMSLDLPSRFYNTIILFPAGMTFSVLKPYFDSFIQKNDAIYWLSLSASLACMFIAYKYRFDSYTMYSIWAVFFMLSTILVTMKVKFSNDMLAWFGTHVFSIYILMRLPMQLFDLIGLSHHTFVFIVMSFVATVALMSIFEQILALMDARIFQRR